MGNEVLAWRERALIFADVNSLPWFLGAALSVYVAHISSCQTTKRLNQHGLRPNLAPI